MNEKILEHLALLGSQVRTVVSNLIKLEIKGHAKCGYRCPIFKYLNRKFPEYILEVEEDYISFQQKEGSDHGEVICPKVIKKFIIQFDKGSFEELLD
jgi:hypothetical protein